MPDDVALRITTAVSEALSAGTNIAVVEALLQIAPESLAPFFHDTLNVASCQAVASGVPASPGAVSGKIALSTAEALKLHDSGQNAILIRGDTTPDDLPAMQMAAGIVTQRGGLASHAAIIARSLGIPSVVGVSQIILEDDRIRVGDVALLEGDMITVDGGTGSVHLGILPTTRAVAPSELSQLLAWADTVADGLVEVRTSADNASDARRGRGFGAKGIGLCRTEHMFLDAPRIAAMRKFLLAEDQAEESAALAELELSQIGDFESVLEAMDGLPVTVRLLDAPLHELLPNLLDLVAREATGSLDEEGRKELAAVRRIHAKNPMLGTRGVRLNVVRPGLYQMQVRALCRAAKNLLDRGLDPQIEIMIPLIATASEMAAARSSVSYAIQSSDLESDRIAIGSMIETPRAAIVASSLVSHSDFLSFGTNDLTQMTFGFGRDDFEAALLPAYQAAGLLTASPFASLDHEGVGELVRQACSAARSANTAIKLGVCGEHAGDPDSIHAFVRYGLNGVSCSPYRVPIARLAVARALLTEALTTVHDLAFDIPAARDLQASDSDGDLPAGVDFSADEALVLHVLTVRGFMTPSDFINSLGNHPRAMLERLLSTAHINYLDARDMYTLLPAGRARYRALADRVATEEARLELAGPYQIFLGLNHELKQLCADWQNRDRGPGGTGVPTYGDRCVKRLADVALRIDPILADFAFVVPRFQRYHRRLASAQAAVAAGDTQRFTGVMCESFHDIWMELHGDLVLLQRIDRAEEGRP